MKLKKPAVILTLCLILALIPASFISPAAADSLKKFDLPGMLRDIDAKTQKLGEINKQILYGLHLIDTKSGQTRNVSDRLSTVNQAAKNEDSTLKDVRDVTGQQVTLSRQLNELSRALAGLMNAISGHSATQSGSSRELLNTTADTREQLNEVLKLNRTLEQKLKQAAEKSEKTARSMP